MTQNHVGGGAGGRCRVRQRAFKVSVRAGAVGQEANDLAIVVDAICKGTAVRNGIIDAGENTVAIEKGVVSALDVNVRPDDLARIVDPVWKVLPGLAKGSSRVVKTPPL